MRVRDVRLYGEDRAQMAGAGWSRSARSKITARWSMNRWTMTIPNRKIEGLSSFQ